MSKRFYIPYFPINPYGVDVPTQAMQAATAALENQLGGPCQVLAAKTAFDEAGGLHAQWRGIHPKAITRWSLASQAAVDAAYQVAQPLQAAFEDMDPPSACIDVIAAARYGYTEAEWLNVFTAHFGMSDHCDSHQQALAAGHRWLTVAPGACPIAAADQEIKQSCLRSHLSANTAVGRHAGSRPAMRETRSWG